jgi:hypothetical protein
MTNTSGMTITALTHDFSTKKSFVSLVWENDASQRLGLEVPFGCRAEDLPAEAEKAVRKLSIELATIAVEMIP